MSLPLPSTLGQWGASFTGGTSVGLEKLDTVPAGKWWALKSVQHVLVKGGAGGTPIPVLQLANAGGTVFWEGFGATPGSGQALSTTCTYTWAPGLPLTACAGVTTGVHATAPLPFDLILPPGTQIKTSTLNTVGGTSNYSTAAYFVCELGKP